MISKAEAIRVYERYVGPVIHRFVREAAIKARRKYVPTDSNFARKLAEAELRLAQSRKSFATRDRPAAASAYAGLVDTQDTLVYATILQAYGQNRIAHEPNVHPNARLEAYRQKDICLMQLAQWRKEGRARIMIGLERDAREPGNLKLASVSFVTQGPATYQFHMPYERLGELAKEKGFASIEELVGIFDFDVVGIAGQKEV